MITISIGKADTECVDKVTLTSGMVKAVQVAFSFSEQWDGFNKTAVFSNGNITLDVSLDDEGKCYIPHEVVAEAGKEVSVGVYGSKGTGEDYVAIPTEKCSLGKVVEGVDPTGEEPAEPTPTAYDELRIIVTDLQEDIKEIKGAISEDVIPKDVDLTKCTIITEGTADITSDEITPKDGSIRGTIEVTGQVELVVEAVGVDDVILKINGTEYTAHYEMSGIRDAVPIVYSGVVEEPIEFFTYFSGKAKFTKFTTTGDYVISGRVAKLEHDKVDKVAVFKDVDLTKVTTITDGSPVVEINYIIDPDMEKGSVGYINISGYVEFEMKNDGDGGISLTINEETYDAFGGDTISFKGEVIKSIRFVIDNDAVAFFTKFVTTTDYELHNKVGDIDTALDELHAYAQALIGGASV